MRSSYAVIYYDDRLESKKKKKKGWHAHNDLFVPHKNTKALSTYRRLFFFLSLSFLPMRSKCRCTDRQSSSFPLPPCPQWATCQCLCPVNSTLLGTPRPQAGVNLPAQPKELRGEHKGLKETCQHGNRLKYPRPLWPLL